MAVEVTVDASTQLRDLNAAIQKHWSTAGESLALATASAADDLALWLVHFRSMALSPTASDLLSGAQAAALDTIAYAFLGLGRAAITSIRLQVELLIGYTYFKDHPIEWDAVRQTGDGFMMVSAVTKYHSDIDPTLTARMQMASQRLSPTLQQMYKILSAHVHGQSPYTLPKSGPLQTIVVDEATMRLIVELQTQSIDAVSTFLVAVYAHDWPQLPQTFVSRVAKGLTPTQRKKFFSDPV
ncbi:MAG: hypothetical protein IIC95_00660 [Chloroflexi bacterium]|nr:hypothetical protein [Chloroflexota bacterium]